MSAAGFWALMLVLEYQRQVGYNWHKFGFIPRRENHARFTRETDGAV
jgi:hypothetical protein